MKEVILSPEELFFLARKMKAKYLDYEYLSLMGDIQNDIDVKEEKAKESLSSKGFVEEDFEGNIEVENDVVELLNPVFFGTIECLIKKQDNIKLHVFKDSITQCLKTEAGLSLKRVSSEDISDILTGDLELQCANTEKGTYIQRYTAEDLLDSSKKEEVIKIARGEW